MIIGPHLSISGGYKKTVEQALSIGANTFQAFSRNPRGGAAAKIDDDDVSKAVKLMEEHGFGPILIHAPYTLNMAAAKPETYEFAKQCFGDDMRRMEKLPAHLYVFHPGSITTLPYEQGIEQIAQVLKEKMIPDSDTWVLLETMSGKGSEVGKNFEQLADILDAVGDSPCRERIGACIDTCHLFSAGYDIVNHFEGVLDRFDEKIGLNLLKAVHMNDSMNPFASFKDRHAKIGEGKIGFEVLAEIAANSRLQGLPFFLETPQEDISGYADEISRLSKFVEERQKAQKSIDKI